MIIDRSWYDRPKADANPGGYRSRRAMSPWWRRSDPARSGTKGRPRVSLAWKWATDQGCRMPSLESPLLCSSGTGAQRQAAGPGMAPLFKGIACAPPAMAPTRIGAQQTAEMLLMEILLAP